jgi:hypothetical protein
MILPLSALARLDDTFRTLLHHPPLLLPLSVITTSRILPVPPHRPRPVDLFYSVSTLDADFVWADGMVGWGKWRYLLSFSCRTWDWDGKGSVLTCRMVEDALRNIHLPPHLHHERPLSPPLFANLPPTLSPCLSGLQRRIDASHRLFPPTTGASEPRTAIN